MHGCMGCGHRFGRFILPFTLLLDYQRNSRLLVCSLAVSPGFLPRPTASPFGSKKDVDVGLVDAPFVLLLTSF